MYNYDITILYIDIQIYQHIFPVYSYKQIARTYNAVCQYFHKDSMICQRTQKDMDGIISQIHISSSSLLHVHFSFRYHSILYYLQHAAISILLLCLQSLCLFCHYHNHYHCSISLGMMNLIMFTMQLLYVPVNKAHSLKMTSSSSLSYYSTSHSSSRSN